MTEDERPPLDAFMQYLWSEEAQQAFVKYHFRSVTNEGFNDANKDFARVEQPFTVADLFGGWERTKPEASATPMRIGDRVTPCLITFRVIANFPLASERAGRVH